MSQMGPGGGVSKVTPQAAIIINTSADSFERALRRSANQTNTLYTNTANEDDFCIARGELCFAKKKKEQSTQVYGQNNPSVQVFTSANGLIVPDKNAFDKMQQQTNVERKESEKKMIQRELAKSLWFVGVAQGDKMARDFENRSLALAVRVAGSDTIFNSGTDTFYPGDTVVWDMPPVEGGAIIRYGEPKTKNVFTVKKYDYSTAHLIGDLSDISAKQKNIVGADRRSNDACIMYDIINSMVAAMQGNTNQKTDELMNGGMQAFYTAFRMLNLYKQENYDRRIIGKALSEGKPGMHFDILLHHHHKIS
jgi:hypothetical protein